MIFQTGSDISTSCPTYDRSVCPIYDESVCPRYDEKNRVSENKTGRMVGRSVGRAASRADGRAVRRSVGRPVWRSVGRSVWRSVGRSGGWRVQFHRSSNPCGKLIFCLFSSICALLSASLPSAAVYKFKLTDLHASAALGELNFANLHFSGAIWEWSDKLLCPARYCQSACHPSACFSLSVCFLFRSAQLMMQLKSKLYKPRNLCYLFQS